jgi:hypothetical protein
VFIKRKAGSAYEKGIYRTGFYLGQSGFMRGLESDTIGGFNNMLLKQKKEDGEHTKTAAG